MQIKYLKNWLFFRNNEFNYMHSSVWTILPATVQVTLNTSFLSYKLLVVRFFALSCKPRFDVQAADRCAAISKKLRCTITMQLPVLQLIFPHVHQDEQNSKSKLVLLICNGVGLELEFIS